MNSSVFSGVISPFIEEENAHIYRRAGKEIEGKEGGSFPPAPKINLKKKDDIIFLFIPPWK
jgi:hypothetical protein